MDRDSHQEAFYQDLVGVLSQMSGVDFARISDRSHLYMDLHLNEGTDLQEFLGIMETRHPGFNSDDICVGTIRTVGDLHREIMKCGEFYHAVV